MAIIITTMVIIIIMIIIINMKLKMFQPHHILYNKPRQSQQCNVKPASELLLNTNKLSEILQQSMPNIAYMIYIAYLCKYVCMCVRGKQLVCSTMSYRYCMEKERRRSHPDLTRHTTQDSNALSKWLETTPDNLPTAIQWRTGRGEGHAHALCCLPPPPHQKQGYALSTLNLCPPPHLPPHSYGLSLNTKIAPRSSLGDRQIFQVRG